MITLCQNNDFMKRITLLFATIFLFVGCGSYMTEVWVNQDTSGKTKVSIDAGEMIDMFGMALQEMDDDKDDKEKMKLTDNDSFFGEGKIDSTIVMYDMAPDSVKQKMAHPELLKNMIMEMKGDADKREMIVSMTIQYESPEQLADIFSQLSSLREGGAQLGGGMNQDDMKNMFDNQTVDYKNGIVRIKIQNSLEQLEEEGLYDNEMKFALDSLKLMMNELDIDDDNAELDLGELAFIKDMLDAELKSVYYLPGKVEFTNDRSALIDGNTVIFSDNIWKTLLSGDKMELSDRIIKYTVK